MKVERIETEHGSHIEPPLDEKWSDLQQLEWQAAVAEVDSGISPIRVSLSRYTIAGILQRGYYCVQVGYGHSHAPLNFNAACTFLNGVVAGAQKAGASA